METKYNKTPQKFSFIEEAVPVSIQFENLSYSVKKKGSEFKQLLDGISGQFSSGEFTAILGASGSGKTTLLNILSGYVGGNVKGAVEMNGEICDAKLLRKLSAYIMQNDLLQPHLTVEEELMIVAKLRLPNSLKEKKMIVKEYVDIFQLSNCCGTLVEQLSGGERKRLSIALELISNPTVIYLDEPTSGLDSVTINLIIEVFRQLSSAGRTVICTIHQPSLPIMNKFDQVYFLARGSCIYNGSTENMLPFLTSLNLHCPITYGFSEFVIETVETNPKTIQLLSDTIDNGKVNMKKLNPKKRNLVVYQNQSIAKYYNSNKSHTSFWTQFIVILHRMMLQQARNKVGLKIQLFNHVLIATMLGLTFFGVGSKADTLVSSVYFTWLTVFHFVYNPIMALITVFPFEMEILRREYLNQWYTLKAYYLALSLRALPLMVVLGTAKVIVTYLLSDQPLEIERFLRFMLVCILVGMTSEGLGLAIGSWFGTLGGSIVAPIIMCPIAVMSIYGMGYGNSIGTIAKILARLSYMRLASFATMYAIFENRPPLNCQDLFCLYKDPRHLLRDLGISHDSYDFEVLGVLVYGLCFRVAAYFILRYRMQEELTGKNSDFMNLILKIKN